MVMFTCTALPNQSFTTFFTARKAWENAGKPAAPVDHPLGSTPWVYENGVKVTAFGCSMDPPRPIAGPSIYPHAQAVRMRGWR